MWHDMCAGGPWMFGPFFSVLFTILMVFALVFVIRRVSGHRHRCESRSAEAILAERFARGEIDAEEFRARREELQRR